MKKMLSLIALAAGIATGAAASQSQTCGVVIDYPPGGTSDSYVRLLQKNNPDFRIEYKVGGLTAPAINFMAEQKDFAYFGSPVMYSAKSPFKDPPVQLIRILVGAPILALSNPNKQMSWDKLLTEKINIGVPGIGTSHHMIALQLKEHNPNIEIIPTGGDNKALPMVNNGDLDLYLVSATAGNRWVNDFKFSNLFTMYFNKPLVRGNVKLISAGFNGIFVHRDATSEQKAKIADCIERGIAPKEWKETLRTMGAEPLDLTGKEMEDALALYISLMKKYGL